MLGFVFPGETAAILGGVLASKGGVSLAGIARRGRRVRHRRRLGGLRRRRPLGAQAPAARPAAQTPEGHRHRARPAQPPRRRRGLRRPLLRLPARRRPGPGRPVAMRYRIFLPANAAGGLCWGLLYVLLGYFVGQRVEKATGHRVGRPARPHPRGDRRARRAPPPQGEAGDRGAVGAGRTRERRRRADRAGSAPARSRTERSPARRPATTRANSPAASSPWASVSIQRTAAGSLRSMPKRPKRGS